MTHVARPAAPDKERNRRDGDSSGEQEREPPVDIEVAEDRAEPEPAGDAELNRGAEEGYPPDSARGPGEDGSGHDRKAETKTRDSAPDHQARKDRRDGEDHVADRAEDGRENHRAHDREALGDQRRQ